MYHYISMSSKQKHAHSVSHRAQVDKKKGFYNNRLQGVRSCHERGLTIVEDKKIPTIRSYGTIVTNTDS